MTCRVPFAAVAAILFATQALAEDVTLAPSEPKRWDASVSVGWLGGDKSEIGDRWNKWYDAFATSIDAGRYWTPHLKTEVGAAFTTEGDIYAQEQVTVPGQPFPIYFSREHGFRVRSLNLSASYQLFENAWVHPFVGAGVQVAWERHRMDAPLGGFGRDGQVLFPPGTAAASETTIDPRPFVSGGAKFYVSERGFIRSDAAVAFDGRGATRAWWRVGAGVDF